MDDFSFWFRLANVAFAVFVVMLAGLKLVADSKNRDRAVYVLGIASLAMYVATAAYDRRLDEFSFRIPLATVGLSLAAYALHTSHRSSR